MPVMVAAGSSGERPVRTFVPVDDVAGAAGADRHPGMAVMAAASDGRTATGAAIRRIPGGWSLWGDFEA
jgi:hypothetical protein